MKFKYVYWQTVASLSQKRISVVTKMLINCVRKTSSQIQWIILGHCLFVIIEIIIKQLAKRFKCMKEAVEILQAVSVGEYGKNIAVCVC